MDFENLARVWERVSGDTAEAEKGAAPDPDISGLRGFIEEEEYTAAFYTLLAVKTRRCPMEREFRRIAAREREHERRLQTEHFLRGGDTYTPYRRAPSAPYLLPALRRAWQGERNAAESYEAAASSATDPALAALYRELASDERDHESCMLALIRELVR